MFDNQDHYSALLEPALLGDLTAQFEHDRAQQTKASAPSRRQDHVRETIWKWLQNVDAKKPDTHPVKLADLTFQVYARYFDTFKKKAVKRYLTVQFERDRA